MKYVEFGKTGVKISKLGYGTMRFPVIDEDNSKIDILQAKKMLHYAIDNGVNYVDTAYNYHGGNSEIFVGEALKDGYREKVYLATKLPAWKVEKYEDFEMLLDEQLEKLQTEYIDFYLLHSLGKKTWNKIDALNVIDFIEKAKKSGKIKHIGFSFHDKLGAFKEIIDSYDWDFCQIQYNYMDTGYQAGEEGLNYAYDKGIPVIIMEPIKGGSLAKERIPEIQELWNSMPIKRSPAQWALKWLFNNEKVALVLSGMSELDHVKENIQAADETQVNSLTNKEKDIIDKVSLVYKEKSKVGCTGCEYCMPCPKNIPIPMLFERYNNYGLFGEENGIKQFKVLEFKRGAGPSACIECRQCEQICPQGIDIVDKLKELKAFYLNIIEQKG